MIEDLALIVEARDAARTGRAAKVRRAAGLTQADIAAVIGVTPSAVCRWEAARRTPSGASAMAYGRALRSMAVAAANSRLASLNDDDPAGNGAVANSGGQARHNGT